ncbi:hypothetical protein EI94DRAFT_872160 [Lactarius quietus]|nr:hypothetical protein EI94DRAFT_872160 [Lactarius quietus]
MICGSIELLWRFLLSFLGCWRPSGSLSSNSAQVKSLEVRRVEVAHLDGSLRRDITYAVVRKGLADTPCSA